MSCIVLFYITLYCNYYAVLGCVMLNHGVQFFVLLDCIFGISYTMLHGMIYFVSYYTFYVLFQSVPLFCRIALYCGICFMPVYVIF